MRNCIVTLDWTELFPQNNKYCMGGLLLDREQRDYKPFSSNCYSSLTFQFILNVWYSSWSVLCSQARLLPSELQDAHRAPDSISDNENIRASRGENASMLTDLIYLRSVKARIREEGQSRPCTILLWSGVYVREKRNERTRGGGERRRLMEADSVLWISY